MRVRINYPQLSIQKGSPSYEAVEAREVGADLYELTTHAMFTPFAPGDVLRVDGDVAVGIESLARLYTMDATFMLPLNLTVGHALPEDDRARVAIEGTIAEWRREAYATQTTGLSAYVSAADERWLEDRVVLCPYVDYVQTVRTPDMAIDFAVAVDNADLGDLADGPWS